MDVFLWILQIFKNRWFTEYLLTTAFAETDVTFQAKTSGIFDNLSNNYNRLPNSFWKRKDLFIKTFAGVIQAYITQYNKFLGKKTKKHSHFLSKICQYSRTQR